MSGRFDPRDFFELARITARDYNTEAAYRTSISRAYYAVLLLARTVTNTTGSRRLHIQIVKDLSAVAGLEAAADRLSTLRRYRIAADYYLGDPSDRSIPATWERAWKSSERLAALAIRDIERVSASE